MEADKMVTLMRKEHGSRNVAERAVTQWLLRIELLEAISGCSKSCF